MKTKNIYILNLILALVAIIFLIYIIYLNPNKIEPIINPATQMWLNGFFNLGSALNLFIAIYFVKKKNLKLHKVFIHIALVFSALFLVNYIFYHLSVGHVRFQNDQFRTLYLIILFTHLLSSIVCLPLIFISYSLGIFNKITEHKSLAKFTFCLWEYVSITGVIIILFLKFLHLK